MMTKKDEEEAKYSGGRTTNSAALRCLLAIRNIILSNGDNMNDKSAVSFNPELRIVCQLQSACPYVRRPKRPVYSSFSYLFR